MGHRRPPGTGELLPPHRYIEIPNIEDRLFVNDEHMPLLLSSVGKRGLDRPQPVAGPIDRRSLAAFTESVLLDEASVAHVAPDGPMQLLTEATPSSSSMAAAAPLTRWPTRPMSFEQVVPSALAANR
jgi:hypothetical protein